MNFGFGGGGNLLPVVRVDGLLVRRLVFEDDFGCEYDGSGRFLEFFFLSSLSTTLLLMIIVITFLRRLVFEEYFVCECDDDDRSGRFLEFVLMSSPSTTLLLLLVVNTFLLFSFGFLLPIVIFSDGNRDKFEMRWTLDDGPNRIN